MSDASVPPQPPVANDLLKRLVFDERGLIPAIVQDASSREVLMLAWMNAESVRASISEGRTVFWSRSRQSLWRKGETSGNIQHIREMRADCDADSLLVVVDQVGPACHTGAVSCFRAGEDVNGEDA